MEKAISPNNDAPTPVQLQEAEEFARKLAAIYRFLRFGGKLDGSIISDLANNHTDRVYAASQLWADAVALEGMARELKRQAQQIATQQDIRGKDDADRPNQKA